MNKYKVCVYAICKNESSFIERWVNSMKEADEIYVLDTGSTDNSLEMFKSLGVHVKKETINPWRFDVARNKSLEMVPLDTDICVCTDLDEVFESGWREKLEKKWQEGTDKAKYNYNWSFDKYGNPATTFFIEKIHRRVGYKWVHPVHEVLNVNEGEKSILIPEITLNHYPDSNKSRSSYLPLLELSVKEDPSDDRNMHYLGREYMYYGEYQKCIDTLIRHLELPKSTWDAERCASMRFIARSYLSLNRFREAELWYKLAISEASYLRESYVELASFYSNNKRYQEAYDLLTKAFLITNKPVTYINESFAWNDYIYELMSIVCFNLELYPESLENIKKALELNKDCQRLQDNYDIINKTLNG
ncbi:MAG: glycosyltransferase [Ruminococcus sp.]|nr:glycosyltransferase [Ruminococcus sp.]